MVPERCEQCRTSISLSLDGLLTGFERLRLERHLRSCAACSTFAGQVTAQTAQLRAAALEVPSTPTNVSLPRTRAFHHRTAGFAGAVAVAAMAALVSLTPAGERRSAASAPGSPNSALLAVVAEAPTPNATFQVGRLRLVSAASADGPVRGYYGVPA